MFTSREARAKTLAALEKWGHSGRRESFDAQTAARRSVATPMGAHTVTKCEHKRVNAASMRSFDVATRSRWRRDVGRGCETLTDFGTDGTSYASLKDLSCRHVSRSAP